MKNKLIFKYNDPLNEKDSEHQTYGCRANNPDICKYCMTLNVCAFTNLDNICKHPSSKWKKHFYELRKRETK